MNPPVDKDEYEKRYKENTKISGSGLETTMSLPCAFCAAPDFMVYRIIEVHDAVTKGATCKVCKRSMKGIATEAGGNVQIEIVQTGGDPPPPWIPPMRSTK